MSKEKKYEVHFDETMQNLFLDMNRIQKDFGLKRINSIILLKALLEEKNSILYDFLCATTISKNPYKNIIQDCDQKLKKLKKADCLDGTEKDFQIILPDNQDPITSVLTVKVYNALVKTISTSMTSDQFDEETEKDNKDEENNEILINSEDLLSIFADDMPKEPLTILKNNGVYLDGLFDYFDLLDEIYNLNEVEGYENEVSSNSEKLPKNLSDFVTVLSSKYK